MSEFERALCTLRRTGHGREPVYVSFIDGASRNACQSCRYEIENVFRTDSLQADHHSIDLIQKVRHKHIAIVAVNKVPPGSTIKRVSSDAASQNVTARPLPVQDIVPFTALDRVSPLRAVQPVGFLIAEQRIIAAATEDEIITRSTAKRVVALATVQSDVAAEARRVEFEPPVSSAQECSFDVRHLIRVCAACQ